MDPISPRNVNEIDPELIRIQDLSLEGHDQKLNLEADELKNQFKTSVGDDGSMSLKPGKLPPCYSPKAPLYSPKDPVYSLTAPCMCGGPMHQVHHNKSHKAWSFPDQKLYSAVEDPTRKKYSPYSPSSPRKYRKYTVHSKPPAMLTDDANSN